MGLIDAYLDGTGEFSFSKVRCQQCCKKERKDGSITYYHQMLGACIVHLRWTICIGLQQNLCPTYPL